VCAPKQAQERKMIGTNPIAGIPSTPATTPSTASSTAENQALDGLGPDAFITLLTAQLQAQDPLNPMDPNQMVDELTSMNTLQETIQMRQDLDQLVSQLQGAAGNQGSASSTGNVVASNGFTANTLAPAMAHAASSAISTISKSIAPNSISSIYSQLGSKSKLF
jgi:flagellar basal-body rod modification protein FlgD